MRHFRLIEEHSFRYFYPVAVRNTYTDNTHTQTHKWFLGEYIKVLGTSYEDCLDYGNR